MDEQAIQKKYVEMGYSRGWRFMTCPQMNLVTSEWAIVTLNPGESCQPPPKWDMPDGGYWTREQWEKAPGGESRLQKQVQYLAKTLGIIRDVDDLAKLKETKDLDKLFSAQLVPFCSPSWATMARRDECLDFCRHLWREFVQPRMKAKKIICIGKWLPGMEMVRLFEASRIGEPLKVGWGEGRYEQTIWKYANPDTGHTLALLPHLSRYPIFGRKAHKTAEAALLTAFA
jgi:hypothetical protein